MQNTIVDILRVNDDDYIIAICGVLLEGYSDFRFNQEKRYIKSQIIPSFKQINIEAKKKLLEVAKIFNLEKEFEMAIKEKLLSDIELNLVFEVLGFRKSRFK